VLVIVTRWYGGVHLGPDRFKHINNCTRNMLDAHGFVKDKVKSRSSLDTAAFDWFSFLACSRRETLGLYVTQLTMSND